MSSIIDRADVSASDQPPAAAKRDGWRKSQADRYQRMKQRGRVQFRCWVTAEEREVLTAHLKALRRRQLIERYLAMKES
ncbi:MAG: hypothetical protein ACT4QA_05470 [Panacagrimonas sp.]